MKFFWLLVSILGVLSPRTAADHGKKPPSAVVIGTVYCDTCFHQEFLKSSHVISGASVAVECGTGSRPRFWKEVKTNKRGQFRVELPFSLENNIKQIERCSVKLVRSSEAYCSVASAATSSSLHLKTREKGVHIFTAGFFSFRPLTRPDLCYQKPSPTASPKLQSNKVKSMDGETEHTTFPIPHLPFVPSPSPPSRRH